MITNEEIQNATKIMALSWKEPYGSLMLRGKFETRSWQTNYRGLVLICTSKQSYRVDALMKIAGPKQFNRILDLIADRKIVMINGAAIAIGRLIDCRPMVKKDESKCFCEAHSCFCHIYEDVVPILPIPWKGIQGWKRVPKEIISQITIVR